MTMSGVLILFQTILIVEVVQTQRQREDSHRKTSRHRVVDYRQGMPWTHSEDSSLEKGAFREPDLTGACTEDDSAHLQSFVLAALKSPISLSLHSLMITFGSTSPSLPHPQSALKFIQY